jgi:hypothetical protein
MSRYAGVRVTLTDPRNGSRPILTVMVKDRLWGWDNWVLASPAVRPPAIDGVESTRDALVALVTSIQHVLDMDDGV